jgi:hypothetical protein
MVPDFPGFKNSRKIVSTLGGDGIVSAVLSCAERMPEPASRSDDPNSNPVNLFMDADLPLYRRMDADGKTAKC